MNIDARRLALQESCAEAIILWKTDLEHDPKTAAVLVLSGIPFIYAEDVLCSSESIERNLSNCDSLKSESCSHLSKACWISMSCGENDNEPIGYITEVPTATQVT